ncbi:hypothetical protein Amal_02998 [Acetobacter malorum]|uniref:Uncharacterized protein n=1 Tax=Acetobacter malorum TaxID=178901 RepID=A0A177G963_9PROT|nr:hypothetical protein Amal_02998 [Acetobacter malorum]
MPFVQVSGLIFLPDMPKRVVARTKNLRHATG